MKKGVAASQLTILTAIRRGWSVGNGMKNLESVLLPRLKKGNTYFSNNCWLISLFFISFWLLVEVAVSRVVIQPPAAIDVSFEHILQLLMESSNFRIPSGSSWKSKIAWRMTINRNNLEHFSKFYSRQIITFLWRPLARLSYEEPVLENSCVWVFLQTIL